MAAALLTAASLTLGACDFGGGDSEPEPAAGSTASSAAEPIQLDLLVYNVEYGGGPDTDRVMRKVDADVVGVLESYDRLPEIARNDGLPVLQRVAAAALEVSDLRALRR